MFPCSKNMDPHTQHIPHLREHSPSPYHYHPNWEPTPPHMKMDSFKHPSGFGPWPYSGKMEHNICCNHSYPPGYYGYMPPYFHFQHPPQMYYPGPYPPYPDSYPPYFVPPPYYGVDHSRFDYDKDRNHCCGCPNHVCHRKEGSSVRIEEEQATPKNEEEPDKGPKDSHSCLIGFPNSHNPWVPDNSEGKAKKSSQSLPVLNFHEKFKGLQQGLRENTFKGDDKFSQLPYPIYWLPHSDKPEDPVKDKKETRASPKLTEGWPSICRKSPLKLLDNEKPHDKSVVMEREPNIQNSPDRVAEKERKIRTIPVVHLGSGNEKLSMPENPDEEKKPSKSVTVDRCDVSDQLPMKKDSSKKQQAPAKTTKLRPICLRVDPLPKKNVSNGKARPLSSPGCKEKGDINKENSEQSATIKNVSDKTHDKNVVVIDVKDKPSDEKSNETAGVIVSGQGMKGIIEKSDHNDGRDAVSDADVVVNGQTDDFSIKRLKIDQDKEKIDTFDNKIIDSEKVKNLSPDDAALLIQSAYRGFNVRRWQPLEKLGKIELIRGEVTALKSKIQDYEASSERNVKQREVFSEAIMNFLLQLDAIQGLLPSLREVRRSVASELVLLQEKLDQLTDQGVDEHQQGIGKKDEGFNPASVTISGQPIQYPTEENVSEHDIEASPMAIEYKLPVLDNKSSCSLDQAPQEVDEELVTHGSEYDQSPQDADDNDRKERNSPSNSDKISTVEKPIGDDEKPIGDDEKPIGDGEKPIGDGEKPIGEEENLIGEDEKQLGEDEKPIGEDVVSHPPDCGVTSTGLQGQPEEDYNCDNVLHGKEVKFDTQVVLPLKPDEGSRQYLLDDGVLGESAGNVNNTVEAVTIKDDEIFGERDGGFVVEEGGNVTNEDEQLESYQLEPVLSTMMNLNQAGVEVADTHKSVSGESPEIEYSAIFDNQGDLNSQKSTTLPIAEPLSSLGTNGREGVAELTNPSGSAMDENVLKEVEDQITGSAAISAEDKFVRGELRDDELSINEKKLVEENVELRQMLESLLHAGREQMRVISDMNDRVRNLERRFSRKKKVRANHNKVRKPLHSPPSGEKVVAGSSS